MPFYCTKIFAAVWNILLLNPFHYYNKVENNSKLKIKTAFMYLDSYI